jgi:hypothetical protein
MDDNERSKKFNSASAGTAVAVAFLGLVGAWIVSENKNSHVSRYDRLTREAMTVFNKRGYSAAKAEPSRSWQATFGRDAIFCYDLKKIPDDNRTYDGCVEMGTHARLLGIRPR